MVIEARSEEFKGPLPHPEILRRYNEIVPGSAQSIIDSFVTEGDHRRKQGSRQMLMCEDWAREDIGLQKRGQVFGFILGFTGIAGGLAVTAFSARLGAEIGGGSGGTAPAAIAPSGATGAGAETGLRSAGGSGTAATGRAIGGGAEPRFASASSIVPIRLACTNFSRPISRCNRGCRDVCKSLKTSSVICK